MSERSGSFGPYAALLGVQASFGSLAVIGKFALAVIPPLTLVGFRVGITALALAAIQLFRGRVRLAKKSDYAKLAGLSFLAVTANQILFITGLSLTKAANTSLLASTIPIFTLAAGLAIGTERLKLRTVVGILLAAIGVVVLIDPRNASFSSDTTVGDLLIVLNSLSYGIYVAISKDIVTRNGAVRSIMWIFAFASLICVPLGFFSFGPASHAEFDASTMLLILYIGLVATALPYFLNAWALARVTPSTVAVFVYLQPLIGFLLAVAIIGEKIDLRFVFAASLVFIGVLLAIKKYERSAE